MLYRLILFSISALALLVACGGTDTEANNEDTASTPQQQSDTVAQSDPDAAPNDAITILAQLDEDAVAARVNGEDITITELQREIVLYQTGLGAEVADPLALIGTVLEDLIDQTLITQAAADLNIEVTEAEVEEAIAALEADAEEFGYPLETYFAQQGISLEDLPDRLRQSLIVQKVNEVVTADVPVTTAEVRARHILVRDEATARDLIQQLNEGADFAALAAQYSLDPSTRDVGGDLGWVAPGDIIQPEVEAAIFAIPVNSRNPEPVQSVLGYHIIESLDEADQQPLLPAQLAQRRAEAFQQWLAEQRAAAEIERFVGPNAGA